MNFLSKQLLIGLLVLSSGVMLQGSDHQNSVISHFLPPQPVIDARNAAIAAGTYDTPELTDFLSQAVINELIELEEWRTAQETARQAAWERNQKIRKYASYAATLGAVAVAAYGLYSWWSGR